MTTNAPRIVALLSGPDQKGLVSKVSSWIFENGGNIIHADQHHDPEAGVFFQRIEWAVEGERSVEEDAKAFQTFGDSIGMKTHVAISGHKPKVAIMVSNADHCFHDLVLRWKAGDFPCDIALIISNHETLKEDSENYGIPFATSQLRKRPSPRRKLSNWLCSSKTTSNSLSWPATCRSSRPSF